MRRGQSLSKVLLTLMTCAAILISASANAQATAAPTAEVTVVGAAKLNARQKADFEKFQNSTSGYYGAFWISSNGGWSFFAGLNSTDAASVLAKLDCEKVNGRACTLYATLTPKRAANRAAPFEGLAMKQAYDALRWVRRNKRTRGSVSLAANPHFGWYAWSRNSTSSDSAALRDCNRNAQEFNKSNLKEDQIAALNNAGLLKCRVIWSQKS